MALSVAIPKTPVVGLTYHKCANQLTCARFQDLYRQRMHEQKLSYKTGKKIPSTLCTVYELVYIVFHNIFVSKILNITLFGIAFVAETWIFSDFARQFFVATSTLHNHKGAFIGGGGAENQDARKRWKQPHPHPNVPFRTHGSGHSGSAGQRSWRKMSRLRPFLLWLALWHLLPFARSFWLCFLTGYLGAPAHRQDALEFTW